MLVSLGTGIRRPLVERGHPSGVIEWVHPRPLLGGSPHLSADQWRNGRGVTGAGDRQVRPSHCLHASTGRFPRYVSTGERSTTVYGSTVHLTPKTTYVYKHAVRHCVQGLSSDNTKHCTWRKREAGSCQSGRGRRKGGEDEKGSGGSTHGQARPGNTGA